MLTIAVGIGGVRARLAWDLVACRAWRQADALADSARMTVSIMAEQHPIPFVSRFAGLIAHHNLDTQVEAGHSDFWMHAGFG